MFNSFKSFLLALSLTGCALAVPMKVIVSVPGMT